MVDRLETADDAFGNPRLLDRLGSFASQKTRSTAPVEAPEFGGPNCDVPFRPASRVRPPDALVSSRHFPATYQSQASYSVKRLRRIDQDWSAPPRVDRI